MFFFLKKLWIITINLFYSDEEFIQKRYFKEFGKVIDFNNPVTFREKIQARKVNNNDSFALFSDKYSVREYVRKKSDCLLIPLYGVYDKFSDIDFSELSDFVIKTTHDSGGVYLSNGGYNYKEMKKKILISLLNDYGSQSRERYYSAIPRKIIIEKLLLDKGGKVPHDIKVHCFHGEPKFIQIANSSHTTNDIYDCDWEHIDVTYYNKQSGVRVEKPSNLQEILKVAKQLSEDFDYVRVDLYNLGNKVYFGELTFAPNNGFAKIYPEEYDKIWGQYWK